MTRPEGLKAASAHGFMHIWTGFCLSITPIPYNISLELLRYIPLLRAGCGCNHRGTAAAAAATAATAATLWRNTQNPEGFASVPPILLAFICRVPSIVRVWLSMFLHSAALREYYVGAG
uniref:Uncharacterized protein n=1 Tax=Trichogramma kaykai TaxID=54128 RepID=A0ABD2XH36_9HYME